MDGVLAFLLVATEIDSEIGSLATVARHSQNGMTLWRMMLA
jgi:hypothetical protein